MLAGIDGHRPTTRNYQLALLLREGIVRRGKLPVLLRRLLKGSKDAFAEDAERNETAESAKQPWVPPGH